MRFGIRKDYDHTFVPKGVGIELALPFREKEYLEYQRQGKLAPLAQEVSEVEVLTVHATQGSLSSTRFQFDWGPSTGEFADQVGARTITLHPQRCRKKKQKRPWVINVIHELQEQTMAIFAIETFTSERRIMTPKWVVASGLPMVLDTAHVDHEEAERLIDIYLEGILSIHLSAQDLTHNHLPIDDWCLWLVGYLKEQNYKGDVILEYLPWHHDMLLKDLEKIKNV